MVDLLTVILFCSSAFLLWRYLKLRKVLRELADAAEERKSFLVDKVSPVFKTFEIHRLQNAVNGLVRDVKKASEAEAGHLKQIETTLGNIKEAVMIVDAENRIVLANKALRLLAPFQGSVVGQRVENIFPSASLLDFVKGVQLTKEPAIKEIELLRGRQLYWFEVSAAIMPHEEDSTRDLHLFVLHDMTRQKKLENMRSEFVANVSHELRTPVTIIKGFTDTLADEHESLPVEARSRFLERIQKNVVRLQRLLEDLLALTRLESSGETLHLSRVKLDDLAKEAGENLQDRVKAHGISELSVLAGSENGFVSADPIKIVQVLENLVDNAMRHAKGATLLQIKTQETEDYVECIVEDNGCGIPPKDQAHVFERFYRVDKGRARDSGGTGLGLSIVKHIIQIHHGELILESKPGVGTQIGFRLPKVDSETPAEGTLERTSTRV